MIRAYRPSDAEALIGLYRDSVQGLGPRAYDPAQDAAWAAYPEDAEAFRDLLAKGMTLIATEKAGSVAFGQLHPWDRIAYLYTRTGHERRGHASRLYQPLEAEALRRGVGWLSTAASRLSRPFFEAKGFHVTGREVVTRRGVEIERFEMEKRLR